MVLFEQSSFTHYFITVLKECDNWYYLNQCELKAPKNLFLRNAIIGINWVSEIVYGCVKNQSLKYRRVSPKIKNLKLMRK